MMKRSFLKKKSKDTVPKIKDQIQDLLRKLAIYRDGGCVLLPFQGNDGIPLCNGFNKDGQLILQYDHLNSRQHSISFANLDLGVILCKGHHGWKHFTDNNKKKYDSLMRKIIGPKRVEVWDAIENDRKAYRFSSWDWEKIAYALKKDLDLVEKNLSTHMYTDNVI